MKLTRSGEVSVYTVSGANVARPLPDWLIRRRKRSLRNDAEFQNRVELLQDFEFPEASNCVRVSEDGNWVMSTGTYKTAIHVHSTADLSLSYDRHTTSENLNFLFLSTDASKSLHLQVDRSLQFHTLAGCVYELRIPRFGRDLAYVRDQTEALIPAVGLASDGSGYGEVFRLNLERGQFMKSYQVDVGTDDSSSGLQGSAEAGAVNVAAIAESTHGLVAFGTSIGSVDFFDPRSKSRVATLGNQEGEITALDFSPSGLTLATGSSSGIVKIFDLRRPQPQLQRDHGSGFPIKSLRHITTASQQKMVLAADKSTIKIFEEQKGDVFCSITPLVDINHVEVVPDTGMIFSANEGSPLHTWFIPSIGPAPRWCSFLDSMADEMEQEVQTETFDNYKFLTLPELKSLNLSHLVGNSSLLKPYMSGFFVNQKLYEQARLIANPFMWEEERAKRVRDRIEKERSTRIRGNKKVKVNQKLADKLLKKQEKRGHVDPEAGILGDSRFKSLFEDEEFAVDEMSREFKAMNPSTKVSGQDDDPKWKPQPASDASEDDEDEDDSQDHDNDIMPPKKSKENDVVMRISSSKAVGGRSKDTVFGSRTPRNARASKSHQDVVGEKHVTFLPESRKKPRPQVLSAPTKRSESRRSASSNTFRKL